MFVMSRKSRESIVVGGATGFDRLLKVTVIDICGQTVKLGLEVADNVPVQGWEVWQRLCNDALRPSPREEPADALESAVF